MTPDLAKRLHEDCARGGYRGLISSPISPWPVPDLGYAAEPPLAALLKRLLPAELVLLEGFKKEPVPKLEIHRSGSGNPAPYPHDPDVVAVASGTVPPKGLAGRNWLEIHRPAQILAWVQIFAECRVSGRGYGYTCEL